MDKKIKNALVSDIINKYSSEKELQFWEEETKKGIKKFEKFVLKKWLKQKGHILNIGCGTGREAIFLKKEGFKVTGIDITPKMIELAKNNAKKEKLDVNFFVGDATNLEFKDNSFDYVLMIGQILANIPKRQNRIKALKEAKRVLTVKGKIIISTHSLRARLIDSFYLLFANIYRKCIIKLKGKKYDGLEPGDRYVHYSNALDHRPAFMHFYDIEEAKKDMENAGLTVIETIGMKEIELNKKDGRLKRRSSIIFYLCEK